MGPSLGSIYKDSGITIRTFHYNWCDRTETDRICRKCVSIVVGELCLHCNRAELRKQEKIQQLKERFQKGGEDQHPDLLPRRTSIHPSPTKEGSIMTTTATKKPRRVTHTTKKSNAPIKWFSEQAVKCEKDEEKIRAHAKTKKYSDSTINIQIGRLRAAGELPKVEKAKK